MDSEDLNYAIIENEFTYSYFSMVWNTTATSRWRWLTSSSSRSSWWEKPWIRHWRHRLQLRYQLWVLDWTVPDGAEGYPPLTLYDAATSTTSTMMMTTTRSDSTTTTTTTKEIIMHPYDWKTTDDRVIGGFSTSDISIVMPTVVQQPPPVVSDPSEPKQQQPPPKPFLRWQGNIDTTVGLLMNQNRHVVHRSGYCALYQPMSQQPSSSFSFLTAAAPSMDLGGNYSALEIQARMMMMTNNNIQPPHLNLNGMGSPRTVTVNLTVANSSIPEDMYQGEMRFSMMMMDPTTTVRTNNSSTTTTHHQPPICRKLMQDPTIQNNLPRTNIATTFSSSTTTTTCHTNNRPDAMAITQQQQQQQNHNNKDSAPLLSSSSSSLLMEELPFESFVLPFDSFRVTSRGRERYVVRRLDDRIVIQSIGFIIKDQINGPFCFDLRSIRAVNLLNYDGTTEIVGEMII